PIPRKLIMRSCAEFYKSMLLFRATYAHLIHKSIGPLVAASKRLAKVTTTHRKLPFNSLAGGRTNVLPFALRCTPESAEPASCLSSHMARSRPSASHLRRDRIRRADRCQSQPLAKLNSGEGLWPARHKR